MLHRYQIKQLVLTYYNPLDTLVTSKLIITSYLFFIFTGPDSRISMTKAIVNLELKDPNLKLLGKEGAIPPLLEMLSGNIESKDLSLSALVKLAGSHANKGITVASG